MTVEHDPQRDQESLTGSGGKTPSGSTFNLYLGVGLIGCWALIEIWNILVDKVFLGKHFLIHFGVLFAGIGLLNFRKGHHLNQE